MGDRRQIRDKAQAQGQEGRQGPCGRAKSGGRDSMLSDSLRLIEAVKPTPEFDEAFELGLTLERIRGP